MFTKGNAPPGGRPKTILELREAARTTTKEMLQVLVDIAQDTEERAANRIVAADLVLTRAWGKADAYHYDTSTTNNTPVESLSTNELTKMLLEAKSSAAMELTHQQGEQIMIEHKEGQ